MVSLPCSGIEFSVLTFTMMLFFKRRIKLK
jgi:hypothetical protein